MTEAESWNLRIRHPMQSWEWGEFRKKRQPIDRQNDMLIVWTKIPYTRKVFGYIPMGRVPNPQEITSLRELGKKRNAVGIRIEPEFIRDKDRESLDTLTKTRGLFKNKTFEIDLLQNEEELISKMHQKARYNIRLAEKHGVEIREDNSGEAFEKYLDLMFSGTAKRQGIHMHSRDYHRQMWEELKKGGIATLWIAKYKGSILAADIIFRFKQRIFYAYGATALEHREVMAPTLLLWKIALWGKQTGMEKFDLWGAEEGKGFSRFKEQFGGNLITLPGSFDLIVSPWLYPVFRITEEIRWYLMHKLK